MKVEQGRSLEERPVGEGGAPGRAGKRPAKSVTVNALESPLGWLRSRGHVTERQFAAGEQLRQDWERSQLAPSVTMRWDPAPVSRGRAGMRSAVTPAETQLEARRRFDEAVAAAGPGLADILWRVVCSGEGMREAETALGWPTRAGKLVLTLAMDRVADYYRLR